MQLNDLKRKNDVRKDVKRVGRGGKRGTTSGHGQKGQKSRSGHRIRPAERDLIIRLPKLRGIKNRVLSTKALPINVGELVRMFPKGVVNKAMLVELGIIRSTRMPVKILGNGEIKKAVTVEGLDVSAEARKKIESAGGSVK